MRINCKLRKCHKMLLLTTGSTVSGRGLLHEDRKPRCCRSTLQRKSLVSLTLLMVLSVKGGVDPGCGSGPVGSVSLGAPTYWSTPYPSGLPARYCRHGSEGVCRLAAAFSATGILVVL